MVKLDDNCILGVHDRQYWMPLARHDTEVADAAAVVEMAPMNFLRETAIFNSKLDVSDYQS